MAQAEIVGRGVTADVYRCVLGDRKVAIKVSKGGRQFWSNRRAYFAEFQVMMAAQKPLSVHVFESNVLAALAYWEHKALRRTFTVLELAGESLSAAIHPKGGPPAPFSEEQAKELFKQFLQGLYHLHDQQIVHRDIKPDNVMLTIMRDNQFFLNPMQQECATAALQEATRVPHPIACICFQYYYAFP